MENNEMRPGLLQSLDTRFSILATYYRNLIELIFIFFPLSAFFTGYILMVPLEVHLKNHWTMRLASAWLEALESLRLRQSSTLCCTSFWSIILVHIETCLFQTSLLVRSNSLHNSSTCSKHSYLPIDKGSKWVLLNMWSMVFSMFSCKITSLSQWCLTLSFSSIKVIPLAPISLLSHQG